MSSLYGALSIATQSLYAEQTALEVTSNNIANVNTPGYTRQVAVMTEQQPFGSSSLAGGGVTVSSVSGVRDAVLDLQVNQETQTQSGLSTLQQQLQPLQAMFGTTGGAGLGTAIDGFFNSLQQLSTNPGDGANQQNVINAAQSMASTFQQVAGQFTQQQATADQGVTADVSQVNTLTAQIASLNGQIADAEGSSNSDSASALMDQRAGLLGTLSTLVNYSSIDNGNGEITLTTGNGSTLVAGTQAAQLTTATNSQGMQDIYDGSSDITATITGGSLGGLLQARDTVIPQTLTQLNALASGIATAVNTQNQQGYTPGGAAGGDLFTTPGTNAAAEMSLATTDPAAIASSATAGDGDNANALALAGLQQSAIVGSEQPDQAYASMVSALGTTVSNVNASQQASSLVLSQLQSQQSSEEGVSLDQESVNLTQFQHAYTAAAQVINIINELTETAIEMGSSTS